MTVVLEGPDGLASAWKQFDEVSRCLRLYLGSSEEEFGQLIQALDVCWNMAEAVHRATAQLEEFTDDALSSQTGIIRQSLLSACSVFKIFLTQIQAARGQLAATANQTSEMLTTAFHLQKNIAPLKHVAFHFRLEASRLADTEGIFLEKAYQGTKQVVNSVQQAGDSQQAALREILDKLATATQLVEQSCSVYTAQAEDSEQKVARSLAQLTAAPRDLLRVRSKASALGTVLSRSIGEAVKALQGHDAIRQRLEHILEELSKLREGRKVVDHNGEHPHTEEAIEPGHALVLQRRQAASVMDLVVKTGKLIERELNVVIDCSKSIGGDDPATSSSRSELENFEAAVDHLAALSTEVAELLQGEAKMGHYVVAQIDPIRELLKANSRELEKVAESMKGLALNVLIAAGKIPSAKGVSVLGVWTANAADQVLHLATRQNKQFSSLRATLQSQTTRIASDVEKVETCLTQFAAQEATEALRSSRRREYDTLRHLSAEASQLRTKTEALMQSVKFVDEGIDLLKCLDSIIDTLLSLYPKPERPFDIDSASAGYTMQEQHDTHGLLSGDAEESSASNGQPAEAKEFGSNVDLF